MIYKILVTTVASRVEAVSIKTDVLEFDHLSEATLAVRQLRENYNVGYVEVNRRVAPINFTI